MNRKRQKILLAVLLVILGGLVFALYQLFWYGGLELSNLEGYETVMVNDTSYAAASLPSSLRLRPGTHSVKAYGPLRQPIDTNIEVGLLEDKALRLEGQLVAAGSALSYVAGDVPAGYSIAGGSLLENNFWAVVFLAATDGNRDGSVKIYRFNGREWEAADGGTGLDRGYLSEQGYPEGVITYLENARG